MVRLPLLVLFSFTLLAALRAPALHAQANDAVFIQLESSRSLAEMKDRARAWSALFDDVSVRSSRRGWHAIVVGPMPRAEAAHRLRELRRDGLIPQDAFLASPATLPTEAWRPDTAGSPAGGASPAAPPADSARATPANPAAGEESPAEARRGERRLSLAERRRIQEALRWFGHYDSAIDGAFGPGTRRAMRAWQEARGFAPTGVLTSRQRGLLLTAYEEARARLGLTPLREEEAGIEILFPAGLADPSPHYAPPLVRFDGRDGNGVVILLISAAGDGTQLPGIAAALEALRIVPAGARRSLSARRLELTARDGVRAAHAWAEARDGTVKGFLIAWPVALNELVTPLPRMMRESFRSIGDHALDPSLGEDGATGPDLLAGLELRRPERVGSGAFLSGGLVLTAADNVLGCGRITLDDGIEAGLRAVDEELDIAILAPLEAIVPPAIGTPGPLPRQGTEIAASGFSFGGLLDRPLLTFLGVRGVVDGPEGAPRILLEGELADGDIGGPALDSRGRLVAVVVPPRLGARQLPPGTSLAVPAAALEPLLSEAGVTRPARLSGTAEARLDAYALHERATLMTTRVACWN